MLGLYIIGIAFALIGMWVQWRLKSKFEEYSKVQLGSGLSGKEIAERMLRDNAIFDVKVISVEGQLTDHYNPVNKTVNLSQGVYHGRSAASAAVAAHECGHAVQHATAYTWLGLRSKLVPVVSVASGVMPWILMAGVFFLSRYPSLLLIAIIAQAAITLFTIVTLPVEYDASNRALAWIQEKGVANASEFDDAKDALNWAARTYVVAALAAIAQLLYLISRYSGRRE
ncbi:MAG: zinc metallopeptidase [Crocinitomicaceae bacterium]|nr:zinc metallopeptidase [Crocinitomicaceae bacterium]